MVKSKKDELIKEKDNLRKEFEKLIFDNPDVSQELFNTIIELFNENTAFRKKFGLKPINTKKTKPVTIDNPIYYEIVKQLLQGNKITLALDLAGEVLSKTKTDADLKKSKRHVARFYYETAGGQNEKNIQKTFKTIKELRDMSKK